MPRSTVRLLIGFVIGFASKVEQSGFLSLRERLGEGIERTLRQKEVRIVEELSIPSPSPLPGGEESRTDRRSFETKPSSSSHSAYSSAPARIART
jgi:hypothetical protein